MVITLGEVWTWLIVNDYTCGFYGCGTFGFAHSSLTW